MSLFGFTRKRQPVPVRAAPPALRLYAIGDVHGRYDLLRILLEAIGEEAEAAPHAKLIFLGDYIDRGPQSREVVETLIKLDELRPGDCIFLKGNHDDTLVQFTEDAAIGRSWCNYGGAETLESYGVSPPDVITDPEAREAVRAEFVQRLDPRHLAFFQRLPLSAEFGDYFFAHAGVRPGVALDEQEPEDLLWIRDEFLRGGGYFDKAIVHGHTPEADAFVSARRIGVDTGAYASGILTAVVLEGTGRRLIQARIKQGRASIQHVEIATPAEA